MPVNPTEAVRKRDAKMRAVMSNLAPIWLVHNEFRPFEDSLLFNIVYVNSVYGWINERLKYDAYNDVLYHLGTRRMSEAEALPIQEQEMYISGEVATQIPNDPAYRLSPPLQPGAKG